LLLVGLYRPASAGSLLSVGYWEQTSTTGTSIVRESCTLDGSYTATVSSTVIVADDVAASAQRAAAIAPASFATAANVGWVQTAALTTITLTSPTPLPAATLTVGSTAAFVTATGQPATSASPADTVQLTVFSSAGGQTVTCTSATATSFGGCLGGVGTASSGAIVTQATSISAVTLVVT
jgi:hypothetical protein